jgi:hypothetical protein
MELFAILAVIAFVAAVPTVLYLRLADTDE